jgi:hypothetical protein
MWVIEALRSRPLKIGWLSTLSTALLDVRMISFAEMDISSGCSLCAIKRSSPQNYRRSLPVEVPTGSGQARAGADDHAPFVLFAQHQHGWTLRSDNTCSSGQHSLHRGEIRPDRPQQMTKQRRVCLAVESRLLVPLPALPHSTLAFRIQRARYTPENCDHCLCRSEVQKGI